MDYFWKRPDNTVLKALRLLRAVAGRLTPIPGTSGTTKVLQCIERVEAAPGEWRGAVPGPLQGLLASFGLLCLRKEGFCTKKASSF